MSRPSRSTRGIVLTSFSLASALVVAACTPPMPPDVKAALAESQITCQSGDVQVAVPTDFTGTMTAVGDALTSVCPEQTVTEVAVGDSAGVTITDRTPTAADIAAASAQFCAGEPAITIPAFAYPVTIAYNILGLEGLVMTPEVVAGILTGAITTWDDPAIAEANPGYDLTGLPPIDLISVDSSQGPVEAMTAWLAQQAPEAWTAGQTGVLEAGQKVATSEELLAQMSAVEGSVAVLPTFQALGAMMATANLPAIAGDEAGTEVVITTDDTQAAKIGAGATTMTTDEAGNITASVAVGGVPLPESFDQNAANVVVQEGQQLVGWPVMGFAHAYVCDAAGDPLPLSFAQYLVRMAGQGSLEAFGLSPLPEPIRVATFVPLRVEVTAPEDAGSQAPSGEASTEPEAS